MPASWEQLNLCCRYQPGQLFRKIGRCDDVVLSTDDQSRGFDPRQLARAVKRQHGVDPAGNDLDRSERGEVLGLQLAKAFVVSGDPPAGIPIEGARLQI